MTERPLGEALMRLLDQVASGSAEAKIDGTLVAVLDAEGRNLTIDVDPFLTAGTHDDSPGPQAHLSLWKNRGIPSALARSGWQVSLQSESRELMRMGRGVSALTGHVHASPTALWKLRRFL